MQANSTSSNQRGFSRLRIGFEQFFDSGWTGGIIYLQNLFAAINALDPNDRPFTVLTCMDGDKPRAGPVDKQLQIPGEPNSLKYRAYRQIALKISDRLLPPPKVFSYLKQQNVNAFFTCSSYPHSTSIPLIGWIPDFQYRHLPDIAGEKQASFFESMYRGLIRQSKVIILSSNDALNDLKTFFPAAVPLAHVVQFVAQIPPDTYAANAADICKKYSLPQRFFYLPNQFWAHKNHQLVVKALQILKKASVDITVACTGNTHDFRNPNFFPNFLAELAQSGVHDRFRILGLVPRSDVYQLNRQSMALLQPSLFEGWSTSIEEAKSLGKRVIASDLAVHHEQLNQDADFFPRHDPQALADVLARVAQEAPPGPDLPREASARAALPGRTRDFALRFLQAAALACDTPSAGKPAL